MFKSLSWALLLKCDCKSDSKEASSQNQFVYQQNPSSCLLVNGPTRDADVEAANIYFSGASVIAGMELMTKKKKKKNKGPLLSFQWLNWCTIERSDCGVNIFCSEPLIRRVNPWLRSQVRGSFIMVHLSPPPSQLDTTAHIRTSHHPITHPS